MWQGGARERKGSGKVAAAARREDLEIRCAFMKNEQKKGNLIKK
jgi:hypothetical protein